MKWIGLSHITTSTNCNKILENRGFSISVIGSKSVQWLGNGVYFWNNSDDEALDTGKFLARNKACENEKLNVITINLQVNEANYVDLDCSKWDENFADFLSKINEDGKNLLKKLNKIKSIRKLSTGYQNEIYGKFGELIDIFVKEMNEQFQIEAQLIAYSFYTGYNYRKLMPCERKNKQFCLKDAKMVNNIIDKWIVEEI